MVERLWFCIVAMVEHKWFKYLYLGKLAKYAKKEFQKKTKLYFRLSQMCFKKYKIKFYK